MYCHIRTWNVVNVCVLLAVGLAGSANAWEPPRFIMPEQRWMEIRDPSMLRKARLPDVPPPLTVSDRSAEVAEEKLSLDEAIGIALANSEVVRVLTGVSASPSGSTIYDPAITNTQIDRARARFDPEIRIDNNFSRRQVPGGLLEPLPSTNVRIVGPRTHDYDMTMGLSKTTTAGGTASLGVNANSSRTAVGSARDLALNPLGRSSVDLSYTQPLLQGAGPGVNLAPIVIARIDTERSFFQMKDSVQVMVRGVIDGYWALVFARTDVWARKQQVEQGQYALNLAETQLKIGKGSAGDVAQSRSALAGFRAGLISAEADVIEREAALRNIMGLPPATRSRLVPVTPPETERLTADWREVLELAGERRPDLIELKLVIEADEQQMLIARNETLPSVDATALYRWNGLKGRTPDRTWIATDPGDFTGWQLGVTFSVPLGLRDSRAKLRRQELVIMRDQANLQQGLHNATHVLAASYRRLAQYYEQYRAFQEARVAARKNLDVQFARYKNQLAAFLDVLRAITEWSNSVGSESSALIQYNMELAMLEQQTGTILDTHGVRFVEERFASIGPLGRLFRDRCYPMDRRPDQNVDRYPASTEPSENVFDLRDPLPRRRQPPDASRRRPRPRNINQVRFIGPERLPPP